MRIVLAALVCAVILGGVWMYTSQTAGRPGPAAQEQPRAETVAGLVLELYATAPLAPGAFGTAADSPAVELGLHGQLLATIPTAPAFAPQRIALPALPREHVELLLRATMAPTMAPADSRAESPSLQALRCRLLRDNTPLAEATAWSSAGLPVTIALPVDLRHVQ